ncbi:DoxX family protein [Fibrella sp. WM1]|uniref:DoxX family protein n=1 Tax=Fibrella musci TaxID=3242485 RepID=UPI003520EF36
MKTTNLIYWITTGLFAFVMLGSAIPDIMVMPEAVQGFKEIGLPAYLLPLVGWAKLFGVIALFVPGFPRLREWAYAGLMIDILGAIYCIAMSGKPLGTWAPILVIPLVGYVSYVYYHKRQQLLPTSSARGSLVNG